MRTASVDVKLCEFDGKPVGECLLSVAYTRMHVRAHSRKDN